MHHCYLKCHGGERDRIGLDLGKTAAPRFSVSQAGIPGRKPLGVRMSVHRYEQLQLHPGRPG